MKNNESILSKWKPVIPCPKILSKAQGPVSICRCHLTIMGIPITKKRQCHGSLIFITGISVLGNDSLYIDTGPWFISSNTDAPSTPKQTMHFALSYTIWYLWLLVMISGWNGGLPNQYWAISNKRGFTESIRAIWKLSIWHVSLKCAWVLSTYHAASPIQEYLLQK